VGEFEVHKLSDGAIEMNFPAREGKKVEVYPQAITQGLSKQPVELYVNEQMYMAVYENENDVYEMQPNLEAIKLAYPLDVSITAPSTQYDFVSRYFWPANGSDEDPVTGSLHTGLTPLWAKKLNKTTLNAYQASSRGGELLCVLDGDRVIISGHAQKYLEGEITIS
jgi:predicted PhzF superfamily epimerase YddE/YHI9